MIFGISCIFTDKIILIIYKMTKIHTIGYLGDINKNYKELENILSVDELVYYFIHAANVYQYN